MRAQQCINATRRHSLLKAATTGWSSALHTHEVFNQSTPLSNFNLFTSDRALRESLQHHLHGNDKEALEYLQNFGGLCGSQTMMDTADLAEKNRPMLRQFDNYGRRIDVVDYHSSYHDLMRHAHENEVCSYGFKRGSERGSHLVRAALIYMENQLEPGHCCPLVMTQAAIPILNRIPQMSYIVDKIYSSTYDPRNLPIADKNGVTIGMSMTEKQGGSDVRANTTTAKPVDPSLTGEGNAYLLTGHKVESSSSQLFPCILYTLIPHIPFIPHIYPYILALTISSSSSHTSP